MDRDLARARHGGVRRDRVPRGHRRRLGHLRATPLAGQPRAAAAGELDRDRRRARRADPRARPGVGRALQPDRDHGRPHPRRHRRRATPSVYVVVQVVGACVGAMVANLMFDLPAIDISTHTRSSSGLWLGEAVAAFGLLLVILGVVRAGRASVAAFAVGGYIAAAYWFTSSTSFANPAVTDRTHAQQHLRRHRTQQRPHVHRHAGARRAPRRRCSASSCSPASPPTDLVVPHEPSETP